MGLRTADGRFRLVETRETPPPGGGRTRWENLASTLLDCRAMLVSGAGEAPRSVLSERGIQVIEMEGLIEPALQRVYCGEEIHFPLRRAKSRCGTDCGGNGQGCG